MFRHGHVARRTVRLAEPREHDSQVVVDFCDGADGGTRRAADGFLFDGDGGREALDLFDLRLGHLAKELPGVRGKRFDVSPLAFGVQRVHGERCFTAAAGAAEHADAIVRHVDVDVLQVVLAGSANGDVCAAVGFGLLLRGGFLGSLGRRLAGLQEFGERFTGVRLLVLGDLLRCALFQNRAAARTAFGAEVDDPVGGFDNVQIVFDDQNRVPLIDEAVQNLQQFFDVGKVQAGCRFVKKIQRATGRTLAEFASEFDSLGFTAGQRG